MFKKTISVLLVSAMLLTSAIYAQGTTKKTTPKSKKTVVTKKTTTKKPIKKPVKKIVKKPVKKVVKAKTPTPIPVKKVVAVKGNIFGINNVVFSAKALNGAKYTSKEIFSQNKLTMINFWGTTCNPCIKELPDLQELGSELASKKFSVIGIAGDVTDDDTKAEAKDIVSVKKIDFVNLIPDENLQKNFISKMSGFPVSIFVDKDGNMVGEVITGAKGKDEYKKIVLSILNSLK